MGNTPKLQSISIEDASKIVEQLIEKNRRDLFDEAIMKLAEKALFQDEQLRRRSQKGADGQKRAAMERHKKIRAIALSLMDVKSTPFFSYRQLAEAVHKRLGIADSASTETIRKYLSSEQILQKTKNGESL